MKRIFIAFALFTAFFSSSVRAQEEKAVFKPYGFIRNIAFYDTRITKSGTENFFLFIPENEKIVHGNDVNAVGNYNFQALTTRIGLDINGYKISNTAINAKIEADFYSLNSSGNTAIMRLRRAFLTLMWNGLGSNKKTDLRLKVGQDWHPLAEDKPYSITIEGGSPFTPFSRTPQALLELSFNKSLTFSAAAINQLQYRSAGPDPKDNSKKAATNKFIRHAAPEVYAGITYKKGGFTSKAGVDILSIRPRYGYNSTTGVKYNEWITTFSPFVYLQYSHKSFKISAKSVFAQAGEHMQLLSGYAVSGVKDDGVSNIYTPNQASISYISMLYGKKFQVFGMAGYHKTLGTTKDVTGETYFHSNGDAAISSIVRLAPTLAYNLGKFLFAFEYNLTMVEYGNSVSSRLIPQDCHWINNHRFLLCTKFTF